MDWLFQPTPDGLFQFCDLLPDLCELLNKAFTAISVRHAGFKCLNLIKDIRNCRSYVELLLLGHLFSLKLVALFLGDPGAFFLLIRPVLFIGIQVFDLHLKFIEVLAVRV